MLLRLVLTILAVPLHAAAREDHEWPGHHMVEAGRTRYIRPEGRLVENSYFVLLHDDVNLSAHYKESQWHRIPGIEIVPLDQLGAYAIRTDDTILNDVIRTDPAVRMVHHDHMMYKPDPIDAEPIPDSTSPEHTTPGRTSWTSNIARAASGLYKRWMTQELPDAYWELQAITAGKQLTNIQSKGPAKILEDGGIGVHIYVCDSGMRLTHEAFGGRAVNFKGKNTSDYTEPAGLPMERGEKDVPRAYHGTAVGCFAGGANHGLATGATIVNVRITGANETTSAVGLARAINDIIDEHNSYLQQLNAGTKKDWRGSIINLSLVSSSSLPVETALKKALAAGVLIVGSAGNGNPWRGENEPAKGVRILDHWAPCGLRLGNGLNASFCVSATNKTYGAIPQFSNYGPEVNMVAPGIDLNACGITSDTATVWGAGTSFAAPLVTGAAAIIMSWENIVKDPATVIAKLQWNGLEGLANGFNGKSPRTQYDKNLLFLNSGINNGGGGPYQGAPSSPNQVVGDHIGDWDGHQTDDGPQDGGNLPAGESVAHH